jgi:glycosyltransferase involved in cell wall biosynthesis
MAANPQPGHKGEPRVLRVVTRLNVGGPARQALFLSDELRNRGFETRLVWGASGPDEGTFEPSDDLPATYSAYLQRKMDPVDDLRAAGAIDGVIRRWRPQIVHTHLAKAGALGRAVALARRVPVTVHTFHGHVLQEYFGRLTNRAFATAERALAKRTDALLAVSTQVRDDLLEMGIGAEKQWHVVPVGVDLEPLLNDRPSRADARKTLGLPVDGPIVGCVGRLVPIKDHDTLFAAAARLRRERPDVTFVLAGDGELRDDLKARAKELLGDRCVFLGWVHDLPTLYAAFDVVALTSKLEGTPVSLIEAAAAGKPVVATRVGGVREVVRDGETGLLVSPADPVAVAMSLHTLLDDPEGARRMGEEGTRWVTGRFSSSRLADDVTGLYRELLDRKVHGRKHARQPGRVRTESAFAIR